MAWEYVEDNKAPKKAPTKNEWVFVDDEEDTSTDAGLVEELQKGLRAVDIGLSSIGDIVAAPVNTGVNAVLGTNLSPTPFRDAAEQRNEDMGVGAPTSDRDKILAAINEGGAQGVLAGALGGAGGAGLLAVAPEVLGGIGSTVAPEVVNQQGGGLGAQLAASILGGAAGGLSGVALNRALEAAITKARGSLKAADISVEEAAALEAQGYKIHPETGEYVRPLEVEVTGEIDPTTPVPKDPVVGVEEQLTHYNDPNKTVDVTTYRDDQIEELLNQREAQKAEELKTPAEPLAVPPVLKEEKFAGNINLNRIASTEEIDNLLRTQVGNVTQPTNQSHEETIQKAMTFLDNHTPEELLKLEPKLDEAAEYSLAVRTINVATAGKYVDLARKLKDPNLATPVLEKEFMELGLLQAAAQERTHGVTRTAGRLLNQHNIIARSSQEDYTKALSRIKMESNSEVDAQSLADLVLKHADDPEAIAKIARDAFKPHAEDYLFSLWYNMLLSGLKTHYYNILGTGTNFVADLAEHGFAAMTGQTRRWSKNADRVMGREVGARVYGALKAFVDAQTWKNSGKAFVQGVPLHKVSKVEHNTAIMPGALTALETPTRALAAQDEWWRNIIQLSDMYGMAVRNAGKEGLKGKALWDRVGELVNNPTNEMLEHANDYARVIQFLDDPSVLGKAVENFRVRKSKEGVVGRAIRGGSRFVIPFVRTPDSLIRTAIRRTPLGVFDRYNIQGLKKKGAERDLAMARLTVGSAISAFIADLALDGIVTGQGPQDYRKRQELEASGWQPNSIKIGDTYYSYQGLEPFALTLGGIASLVERGKAGEEDNEGYLSKASNFVADMGEVLANGSWAESIGGFIQMFFGTESQKEAARNNWIASLASSMTTPAIVRQYNQAEDPFVRDTTGDGSLEDRVEGRIMAGLAPENLPQRMDVFGRPITREFAGPDLLSRAQTKKVDDDPVVKEVTRLSTGKTPLVGPPSKVVGTEKRRLTAEEYQEYQYYSGQYILETLRQEMESPEWNSLTDEERVDVVKEVVKEMRKVTREELFPEPEEGEANEIGDAGQWTYVG